MTKGAAIAIATLMLGAGPSPGPDTAAGIRTLSPSRAAEALPASVTGVVTFAHRAWFGAYGFVQDDTAGIYFPIPEGSPELSPGDLVRVSGVTQPGDFAPSLKPQKVEVRGRGPLPEPAALTIGRLSAGDFDSQWVKTQGRVRLPGQDKAADVRTLDIVRDNHRLRIDFFSSVDPARLESLWGAEISVTGVCATIFNERRQLIGVRVMVRSLDQIEVLEAPHAAYFDMPRDPVDKLLRFRPNQPALRGLAHVRGVVTHRGAAGTFTVQDDTGGVQVFASDAPAVGAQVDVVGYAESAGLTPVLRDSIYREAQTAATRPPAPALAEDLLTVDNANRLVSADVVLLDRFESEGELVLSTLRGSEVLQASLLSEAPTALLKDLEPGSTLRLTGVLQLMPSAAGIQRHANSFAISPSNAQLLLRSEADVRIVEPAPYWNEARTQRGLIVLLTCVFAGMIWVSVLRRRLGKQSEQIRAQLERERAVAEEEKALVRRAHGNAADISSSAVELLTASETLTAQADSVRGKADVVSSTVDQVSQTARASAAVSERASARISTAVGANRRISAEIHQIATDVASTSARMQAVSEATQHMGQSLHEVAEISARTARSSAEADEAASIAEQSMARLDEHAGKIGGVLQLIQSIAAQTDLLALNATIEAARAGEAGRGFAVVAAEVKALSRQTSAATDEIRDLVERVKNETRASVTQMTALGERVSSVAEQNRGVAASVDEHSASIREISDDVEQAAAAAQAIQRGIEVIVESAREAATSSDEAAEGVDSVARDAADLNTRFAEMGAAMAALHGIARDTSTAAELVRSRADGIQGQVGDLKAELSEFGATSEAPDGARPTPRADRYSGRGFEPTLDAHAS